MYNFFIIDNSIKYNIFKNGKIMNTQIFKIKKNDTFPPLKIQVKQRDYLGSETGINLSALTSVTFSMIGECNVNKIYEESASTICSEDGVIQYDWNTTDTDESGTFYGEFKLFFSGYTKPTIFCIPSLGGIKIEISDNLNDF
jgi:hypothetical protein